MDPIRIAAAQYPIELLPSFDAWAAKLRDWVKRAVENEARLLVFPEYGAMELAGIEPQAARDLAASLELVVSLEERIVAAHRGLAAEYGVTILGASRPHRTREGSIVNRAQIYCPDGQTGWQDKIVMTRFERETWGIAGGDAIRVFDTPVGRIGISICYDAEFPFIARRQAEQGAEMILVPSATDTMQGYWRVRIGAQARALENQCYTIQAPTIGEAPWLPSLDVNHGLAAIYAPPDGVTPDDGVFAIGTPGQGQWVYADVMPDEVARWRTSGAVLPFRHWPEQFVAAQD